MSNIKRILIDADGCPVVDETVNICNKNNIECLILCDTSHYFNKDGAKTLTFSKGNDSVDFALVNMIEKGDVVITQDYGLATMCLARCARVVNQDGREYTSDNIDALLYSRYKAREIRRNGKRVKGQSKRIHQQDKDFIDTLYKMILEGTSKN